MRKKTFFYMLSLAFIIFSVCMTSYIVAQTSRQNVTAYMWVNINNEWKKLYKDGENILEYSADAQDGDNWYGNTISALVYEENNYITQDILEEFYGKYGFDSESNWKFAYSRESETHGNYVDVTCSKSNVEGVDAYRISGQDVENIYLLPKTTVGYRVDREVILYSDTLYTITLEDGTVKYVVAEEDATIELGQPAEGYCWVATGRDGALATTTDSSLTISWVDQPYTISQVRLLEDNERYISTDFSLYLGVKNSNINKLINSYRPVTFHGYEDRLSSGTVFYVPISDIEANYAYYLYSYEENSTCPFRSEYNMDDRIVNNKCEYVNINGENYLKVNGVGENRNSNSPVATVYYNEIKNVVFDGTNGWEHSYQGAGRQAILIDTDDLVGDKARVTIPNENDITVPSNKLKLVGWYDVTNEKYYDSSYFGQEILTSPNGVFYADWMAASYDNGVAEPTVESVDTSSFVKTYLYDYNDLINALECNYDIETGDWSLKDTANSFIYFTDIINWGSLGHPNGFSGSGFDSISQWTGSARPHQGILEKRPDILEKVFDRTGKNVGVHYLGSATGLFYKNAEGLYEYDSSVASMSYNQSEGKIKLYNQPQNINLNDGGVSEGQFLMLNGEDESYHERDVNYWFGLENEINFDLQANVGSGLNVINGKDMIFSFSGDDDVWVFLDDKLVLDIGGIHDASSASINFNTGECIVNGVRQDDVVAEGGEHVLRMYYLERGGHASNLKTSFLLTPVTSVRIKKVDKDDKTIRIPNAEFTLTNQAGKYYSKENDVVSWSDTEKTVVTDDRGIFRFIGLVEGTYTLNEVSAPFGYNRNPISATIDVADGLITGISAEGMEDISGLYTVQGKATLVAYNERIKIPVNVTKEWNDNNNEAGKRPDSVILQVKNGDTVVQEAEVSEATNWSHEFEVPRYDTSGNEITYTVDEKDTGNKFYIKETIEGNTITNKFVVPDERVSVDATKAWNDNNNANGKRPDSITLQVKNGDAVVQEVEVTEENNWSHTFTDLPKYDTLGNEITYTIDEKDSGNEFYIKESIEGNTITNKFELPSDKVRLEAVKAWNDNDNVAGKRPESITLQVKKGDVVVQEAEVTEADNWSHTFTDLPKYDEVGNRITYTVDEKDTGNKFYIKEKIVGNTVTNKFIVPNEKVSVEAIKAWNDNNNENGKRPDSITLQVKNGDTVVNEARVTEGDNWSHTFTNLPKYDEFGNEIAYTVDEKDSGNEFYIKESIEGNTITNKFDVPNEKVRLEAIKAWNDNNNEAGKRPESITLQVKNGDVVVQQVQVREADNWSHTFTNLPKYDELGNEITYTVDEKDTGNKFYIKEKIEGNTITNKFEVPDEKVSVDAIKAWNDNNNAAGKRPESITLQVKKGNEVVQEAEVTEADNWTHTFTDLQKYDELGNEIAYTVDEKDSGNKFYEKEKIEGNTVTNKFKVPDEKVSVEAIKAWNDNNNEAGKRPESVTLQVKNGNVVVQEAEVTEADNWTHTFTNLQKYDELGNEITYTVDEKNAGNNFYEKEKIEGNTVTNKFKVPDEKVSVEAVKAWVDNNNGAGKRPDSVTLQVKKGNEVVQEAEVNAEDNWSHTFTDLPKYDELGNVIAYTIDEKDCGNEFYIKEKIEGNTVTNKLKVLVETVSVDATKVWNDNNNQAGKRPQSITLQVKLGDKVIQEAEVSAENDWSYTFTDLPKNNEFGTELVYTVDEKDTGNKFYEKEKIEGYTVTNIFKVPDEKVSVDVTKEWNDNDNKAGRRPENVTVQVKNGDKIVQEAQVSAENNWSHTFTDLPKYDELGNEINYTVDEDYESDWYEKTIQGNKIINTLIVVNAETKISAQKIWDDNDNEAGKRPNSVILQLKIGDKVVAEAEVSEKTNWKCEFEVPVYDEFGIEIVYTVDEKDNGNELYEKKVDGNIVTNTFRVPDDVIEITGSKKWEDNNNKEGKRPESVILQLKVGEKVIEEVEIGEKDNWKYTFTDLPKYDKLGNKIKYTIDEKYTSEDYEKVIDRYTVINILKTSETPVDTSDIGIVKYIASFVGLIGIITILNLNRIKKIKMDSK